MKRSEMLAAIRDRLYGTFIDQDKFEEQILATVEELGMLPPIESYRRVEDLDLGIPEWEPEE